MSKHKNKKNNNNIDLLNIYYDEWKYRLDRFRKQMTQSFIVIFFTSTLPISISFFNNIHIPSAIPFMLFPISGICLTMTFLLYCLSEASRIATLRKKISLIISDNFPKQYTKYPSSSSNNQKHFSLLKMSMPVWIPIMLSVIEIVIAVIMIYLIANNAII